ncbi:hypothetical protein CKA32_006063 [Geitlerinema sp. FC II]|nr:hypothetical protein CKA32_006063 [Geitlerinema sp. FC II]
MRSVFRDDFPFQKNRSTIKLIYSIVLCVFCFHKVSLQEYFQKLILNHTSYQA